MLSDAVDLDQLKAKTTDGVLIISVPVAERWEPFRIDVSSEEGGGEAIDTTVSG